MRFRISHLCATLAFFISAQRYVIAEGDNPLAPPIDHGQRVFAAGHSFHVPMLPVFREIAAGTGNEIVGQLFVGGSTVQQVWSVPDRKNTAKAALRTGKVDVLTLSPHVLLPDPGIDQFVDLAVQNNPNVRVTLQLSWPIFDGHTDGEKFDRDATDLHALDVTGNPYRAAFDAQIDALNARSGKPVVYSVPTGNAVMAFREKVKADQVPGVTSQAGLFADPLGHPREVLIVLNAYCHYAVIYRRSPVGLPVPKLLAQVRGLNETNRTALNITLQQLAWDTVIHDPRSGVQVPTRSK